MEERLPLNNKKLHRLLYINQSRFIYQKWRIECVKWEGREGGFELEETSVNEMGGERRGGGCHLYFRSRHFLWRMYRGAPQKCVILWRTCTHAP